MVLRDVRKRACSCNRVSSVLVMIFSMSIDVNVNVKSTCIAQNRSTNPQNAQVMLHANWDHTAKPPTRFIPARAEQDLEHYVRILL